MLQSRIEEEAGETSSSGGDGARAGLRVLRALSVQALVLALTVVVLDLALFFTVPDEVGARFPGYRQGFYIAPIIGRGYPRGYFEAHPERGFDIKPTPTRTDLIHSMDDYSYPIWSNTVGCFDGPVERLKDKFWYVAGDSIAWGHAAHEDLMFSVAERMKGIDILKCAVTHTGQRHQFSKFLEIGKKLGRWPARVFVVYSPTDTANDYMHPHSTVVDGGMADSRMLDADYEVVQLDSEWFDRVRAERDAAKPSETTGAPTSFSLSRTLLTYSMTAQLTNAGLHAVNNYAPAVGGYIGVLGDEPLLDWNDKYRTYKGQKLYDLHRLTHMQTAQGLMEYKNFRFAAQNKAVIKAWRDHALANGYSLEFLLPHPGSSVLYNKGNATNFYKEFMAYLSSLGIKYHDLIAELAKRNINPDDLFWVNDNHMSGEGNEIVGEILAEIL